MATDDIEATIRRLMAKRQALPDQPHEYARQVEKIHGRIDRLLDQRALEAMLSA